MKNPPLIIPGAHDGLSAKLVEEAGFDAVYMGGYAQRFADPEAKSA